MRLVLDNRVNLEVLRPLLVKPPCFEPDQVAFWDDPYISRQMLKAHLDPNIDAASRKPDIIDRTVEWIVEKLDLQPGAALLDLGCGPGLYASRLAARGFDVTGMDISENSLRYARAHDLHSTYVHGNYLNLDAVESYDAALMIYGDLCVLNDAERDTVLRNVHRALRLGGCFVFDVTTPNHRDYRQNEPRWSLVFEDGFWKPDPHLVLFQAFEYPEQTTRLEQYLVIEASGQVSEYRIWTHYYTAETITAVLEAQGFAVIGLYGDLMGTPLDVDSEWIGVLTRKC